MSAGAYALLRFADTEKLLPAIEQLSALDSVEQWHAVDGHYHLILKISSPDQDLENALASLDGLEFRQLCVVRESSGAFTVDPEQMAAYVFVELSDNGAERAIQSKDLSFASLAYTDCGAIGILQRPTFEDVDRVVEGALRSLDGVLRVKRDWIIDLTQL
jgi:hypothetical protein